MKRFLSGILASFVLVNSLSPVAAVQVKAADTTSDERVIAHRLYVSPDGDDNNGDGSKGNPFATIERAKEGVRALDKSNGDIVVEIADGFYSLDDTIVFCAEDSGTENCTIYYEAAEGAEPVISGGREVTGTWKEEGEGIYSIAYNRNEKLRSLYVNGERAHMTSKELNGRGGYGTYKVTENQDDWAWISGSTSQGTLFDKGSIPIDTPNPDDIELLTQTTWNTAIVCVDNLEDLGNGKIAANLQMPYGAIAQKPSWGNNYKVSGTQKVYNVFEWLDEPGEFYFDKTGQRLYYYPREGENLDTAQVIVPELETLINLQGENTSNRIHDISVEGLTFAYTDWNLYEIDGSAGRATVQGAAGIVAFSDGNWHPSIYRAYDVGPGAVMASSAEKLCFENNTICHTGNDGLSLVNDVTETTVNGNILYDLAGSSLLVGHPQHVYIGDKGSNKGSFSDKEKYDADVEGACEYLTITNNFISDTSKLFWGDAGVMIFLGANLTFQYNHVQNTPYSSLSLGWGWWNMDGSSGSVVPGEPMNTTHDNTITHNTFLNTITELGDGGAIYTLGDMPNTVISENYICGIGTPGKDPYHIRGIHVDEGSKHLYGEKNVIEIPTKLTCVDCGNWGNKGNNTWDNNYSTSDSYTTTGTYEPGTVITNKHTNAAGIWGSDVFEILANAGVRSSYFTKLPGDLYNIQDQLLPTKFFLNPDQELNFHIDQAKIEGDIWLAPEGTEIFAEGTDMTKAAEGKIYTPKDGGSYKLYLVKGESVSEASKGEIIIAEGNLSENIEEGGFYKTSQANPFAVQLKSGYIQKATLNVKEITSGYKITEEGEQELKIIDLNGSESIIRFSTYIEFVDKVFPKNTVRNQKESVILSAGESETYAWFVPQGMEISDVSQLVESDEMTRTSEPNATVIDVPEASGKYVLYLVKGKDISGPSDAVLTVTVGEFSVTEGLIARYNADDIEAEAGEKISQWQDIAGEHTLLQKEIEKQPTVKETSLGMRYVEFDGTASEMVMDSTKPLDLNGKSELTILAFSAFTGEDPSTGTYGDRQCTLYFGETGSWGSIYLSSYGGFIVSRFGSGQGNNYIKADRAQKNNDFVMTAMVKDGTTEYLYDAGKKIAAAEGKYEKTAGNDTRMMVGRTASGTPSYFKGGISEILIYDRALSEEEITTLQSYMMQKYYLSRLNPVIEEAQIILSEEGAEDKYNENSWKNLQNAYNQAIEIKGQTADGEAMPEEIEAAYENLRSAIDNRKEVITDVPAAGLNLWLKADEGVVLDDNGKISVWKDSSGDGNNAVIAQNPKPNENLTAPELVENGYCGKPVVRFNGTSDGMQFPFANIDQTAEITVVIVSSSKFDKSETYGGDNIPLLYFHEYGAGWSKFVVTPTQTNVNVRFGSGRSGDNGGFLCYQRPDNIGEDFSTTMAVKSGSEETIYVGDQEVMTRSDGAAVFTNVKDDIGYLGRYPVGNDPANWYNQSDVAEIMIYNRALGLAEIQQINAYIDAKYTDTAELTAISLEGPAKTDYAIGEELDLTGLTVTAHYSDGSEKVITEGYQISGFESIAAGEKTITVTYEGKTASFTVYVKESESEDKKVTDIFVDVEEDDWFAAYVQEVYDRKIMTGMDETHFGSALNLNRGQFATILYRMEGRPYVEYKEVFSDVVDGEFYTDAVIWANSEEVGVITGYTIGEHAGKFGPADDITREQMAVMLYRYAKYKGYIGAESGTEQMEMFPDADNVSEFAVQAVAWAVSEELIIGDKGMLNPTGVAPRAQCAAIIQRFMEKYNR